MEIYKDYIRLCNLHFRYISEEDTKEKAELQQAFYNGFIDAFYLLCPDKVLNRDEDGRHTIEYKEDKREIEKMTSRKNFFELMDAQRVLGDCICADPTKACKHIMGIDYVPLHYLENQKDVYTAIETIAKAFKIREETDEPLF